MTTYQRILLFSLSWCALVAIGSAHEPDFGSIKHLPIPSELQGLWAKGRHCNDPLRQLHILQHAMRFGMQRPVRAYYSPPDDINQYGGIVPDIYDPAFTTAIPALTYAEGLDFLFEYGNDADPEQLYYRCPARKPHR